ncbi:hypothetical protein [Micromonospora sp. WMMD980]|uniref:hypothetical protein n=1 Tax=Micromonospora sp. WMMD980 TaxID=3016088 RepID=UPI0024170D5E|nr:hypothetical protein [Micromonospora sp. WMMD980]MDG4803739.1 hypothetical protein [Micromonospora sp. WMMD980]
MQDRHLLPGQAPQLRGERGLIVFDGEQVVGVALLHEVDGVGALRVHGIGGDHRVGQVRRGDLVQHGRELTDFVGLRGDLAGGEGDRVGMTHGGRMNARLPSGRMAPRRHLPSTATASRRGRSAGAAR